MDIILQHPADRRLSGLELWRVWNDHHNRVTPPVRNPTKMQKLRTKQAIKRSWNAIATLHGNQLRTDLCTAIERSRVWEIFAYNVNQVVRPNLKGRWRARKKTNVAEERLKARVRYLENLTALTQIERRIGAPVADLEAFDAGNRITLLRTQVDTALRRVGHWRRQETMGLRSQLFRFLLAINARREEIQRARIEQQPESNTYIAFHGGNSETKLGLWIVSDANRNITDRVMVKDVCFDQRQDLWNNPIMWRLHNEPIRKFLTEAHLMRRMRGLPNIVRSRGIGELHVVQLLYRLFIEYYPYGDASSLLDHHRRINKPIPEPLIWHIFESLVNAGLVMEQGHVSQAQNLWREIVHLDLKPANIFIGHHPQPTPAQDNWAAYPTFDVGDFGLAMETSATDPRNPENFWGAGTPGWRAPEQTRNERYPRRLRAKTNVFGVGITVLGLMSRNKQVVGPEDSWDAAHRGLVRRADHVQFTPEARADYSPELQAIVEECVEYYPVQRPSFRRLRDRIFEYTRGPGYQGPGYPPEDDKAKGWRRAIGAETISLGLTPDRYAIGQNVDEQISD